MPLVCRKEKSHIVIFLYRRRRVKEKKASSSVPIRCKQNNARKAHFWYQAIPPFATCAARLSYRVCAQNPRYIKCILVVPLMPAVFVNETNFSQSSSSRACEKSKNYKIGKKNIFLKRNFKTILLIQRKIFL